MIMLQRLLIVAWLLMPSYGYATGVTTSAANPPGGTPQSVTAFPASPAVGDQVVVTDDSAIGACDSAAGTAVTLCRWNGSAWVALGDGGAPTTATYIMQTANAGTSAEQALGALATGCLGSTTTTGVVAARTITGTSNEITVTNGDCSGAPTISLPSTVVLSGKTVRIPNSTTLPATCAVGDEYMDTDATSGARFYLCESTNTWIAQGTSTGIGGTVGTTTNAVPKANGTGGSTLQASGVIIDASNNMAVPGTLTTGSGGGTNGQVSVSGSTSGGRVYTTPTTGGFTITDTMATQTSGNATVTVPDLAGVNQTPVYNALAAVLTGKTIDAEGTGNVITLPRRLWFPAAGCNNVTAGSIWDLPTSNPAVAACVTGTNTQKGVLGFADSASLSAQITYKLPSTWTGTVDANIKWYTSATSGDVVWQLATICVADAETDDPAFNTASTVTDTAKGTTLQTNDASITTVTVTGCAASELMHVKILRDSAHASDTLAATANLIGIELVIREAI